MIDGIIIVGIINHPTKHMRGAHSALLDRTAI